MSEDTIISLVLGLIGGGGVWQGIQAWQSHRKGVREHEVAHDQHALNALVETVDTLRTEITRLGKARAEDAERLTCQEKRISEQERNLSQQGRRITDLDEENRLYRRVILGVVERLRRIPPLDADSILTYIAAHIPLDHEGDHS